MQKQHHYKLTVNWTGNPGHGTTNAAAYQRSHTIQAEGKELLSCSSDTAFRGDASKYNPEDMFLASLSACHMLWYLHLCADAGIIVMEYTDNPEGLMVEECDGNPGRFIDVCLHPVVHVAKPDMVEKAIALHHNAHGKCFIANSCNFPVRHQPRIVVVGV